MNTYFKHFLGVVLFLIATSGFSIEGCTDPTACNYDMTATIDDGSCDYSCFDCTFPINDECLNAQEITPGVTIVGSLCCAHVDTDMQAWAGFESQFGIWYKFNLGEFDVVSFEFWNGIMQGPDDQEGTDAGIALFVPNPDCSSLEPIVGGIGFNGNPLDGVIFSTTEFGLTFPLFTEFYICVCTSDPYGCGDFVLTVNLENVGCTDPASCSYEPQATIDDGSCIYLPGCQDPIACNYQPAYCPGGECVYSTEILIQVFNDINQNGEMEWYEATASTGSISIPQLNLEVFPDEQGFIWIQNVDPGFYTLSYNDSEWLAVVNDQVATPDCETFYFGIYNPAVEFMDQISYPSPSTGIIGCLSSSSVGLWLENIGTMPLNGVLTISFTDSLENNAAYNSYGFVDIGSDGMHVFQIEITDFNPVWSALFHVNVLPPPVEYIGHTFNFEYHLVLHDSNEGVFYENTWNESRIVNCAYDPNQKTGSSGYSELNYILSGDDIEYLIEFQNTGSAAAQDVVIYDQIDLSVFDIQSLQTTAGSHSFSTIIQNDGLVKFQFHNIMLPDSNSNEIGSHGFVSYRIGTLENLPFHTVLNNTAEIYFDNNPAIITNTTTHTIFDCTALQESFEDIFSCQGELVTIESEVMDYVETYDWFLDGNYHSSGPVMNILSPEINNHQIDLVVSNPLCSANNSMDLTVYALPQPVISQSGDLLVATGGTYYEWYLNGVLIAGENSAELPVNEYASGDYTAYVVATDVNGCSAASNVLIGTGVLNNKSELLSLFPNPMDESANLKLPEGNWTVACFNAIGELVFQKQQTTGTMQLMRQNFSAGVFLLQISNAEGESFELKIVVR